MPTIRSGSSAATASTLSSAPFGLSTTGSASPSSSCAHGHTANGCSPYQSRMPTGITPSASRASWSLKPTETTARARRRSSSTRTCARSSRGTRLRRRRPCRFRAVVSTVRRRAVVGGRWRRHRRHSHMRRRARPRQRARRVGGQDVSLVSLLMSRSLDLAVGSEPVPGCNSRTSSASSIPALGPPPKRY